METIKNLALLVMDMQVGIASTFPNIEKLTENNAKAIAYARTKNITVIFIVVGFQHGLVEISDRNKSFVGMKNRVTNLDMNEFKKVLPALAPKESEVVITKQRFSAFTGTHLDVVLRSLGIHHLVLTGVATSGVVLSTLREAADKDFQITVLEDCCGDRDEEVHRVLTTKFFPHQAEVMSVKEFCS